MVLAHHRCGHADNLPTDPLPMYSCWCRSSEYCGVTKAELTVRQTLLIEHELSGGTGGKPAVKKN
jgi:hypothetical protein